MNVMYRGKTYEVVYTDYLGRDSGLYGLKSRFSGGAVFPAKKRAGPSRAPQRARMTPQPHKKSIFCLALPQESAFIRPSKPTAPRTR